MHCARMEARNPANSNEKAHERKRKRKLTDLPRLNRWFSSTCLLLHGHKHEVATVNPSYPKDLSRAHSLIRVSMFTPAPSHIEEKHFRMLITLYLDRQTSGEHPNNSASPLLSSYLTIHRSDLTNPPLHLSLLKNIMNPSHPSPPFLMLNNSVHSSTEPNTPLSFFTSLHPNGLHQFLTAHLICLRNVFSGSPPPSPKHLQSAQNAQTHSQKFLLLPLAVGQVTPQCPHSLKERLPVGPHYTMECTGLVSNLKALNGQSQQSIEKQIQFQPELASPPCDKAHTDKIKKKGNKMAIRRSPRLQAKQRTPCPMPKSSNKAKSFTTKLLFDLDRNEGHLDAGTTLSILQASGLKIDKQVEDMIEKAVM